MSDNEYTPSMDQLRDVAILGAMEAAGGEYYLDLPEFNAQFARAIAAHDAEVRRAALEEAARQVESDENFSMDAPLLAGAIRALINTPEGEQDA